MVIAMGGAFAYVIAIVFFVIALNFVMLRARLRRDPYRKPDKAAISEKKAEELRDRAILRRIEREQEEAAHLVELKNKTLNLYEQVRQNAARREAEEKAAAIAEALKEEAAEIEVIKGNVIEPDVDI